MTSVQGKIYGDRFSCVYLRGPYGLFDMSFDWIGKFPEPTVSCYTPLSILLFPDHFSTFNRFVFWSTKEGLRK